MLDGSGFKVTNSDVTAGFVSLSHMGCAPHRLADLMFCSSMGTETCSTGLQMAGMLLVV